MSTRREFLIRTAAVVAEVTVAANLSTVSAVAQQIEQTFAQDIAQTPAQPRTALEPILRGLDREVSERPERLNEIARELSGMACEVMGKTIGRDGVSMAARQVFLENDEFVAKAIEGSPGCLTTKFPKSAMGYVIPRTNISNINLAFHRSLSKDPKIGAASRFFETCGHETLHGETPDIHINPPVDILNSRTGEIIQLDIRRGGIFLFDDPALSREGMSCFRPVPIHIEEAVYEHATVMMMREVGFVGHQSVSYPNQVYDYGVKFVNRLFDGEHKGQLRRFVDTDPDAFYGDIGRRVKASPYILSIDPNQAKKKDEDLGEWLMFTSIRPIKLDDFE